MVGTRGGTRTGSAAIPATDFTPAYVARARQNAPQADFVLWDSSHEPVPEHLKGHFDLVISRRGPTSVIVHLPELCVPRACILCIHCIHPDDGSVEARVRERLAGVGLTPDAQWHTQIKGFLPTLEDFLSYRRFHGDARTLEALHAEWYEGAETRGFPMEERRYIYLVRMP